MIGEAQRCFKLGAEVVEGGGVHFRVWAPRRRKADLVITGGPGSNPAGSPARIVPMQSEGDGCFFVFASEAAHGTRYRYRLDDSVMSYPDPVSRFQPEGPHESSQVIDPGLFQWSDHDWRGVPLKGQVFYEMHIGTFTPEGTWAAAARELEKLADIGITVLELMPVSEFPGKFGWGYDGVDLFAPTRLYGLPDDFRFFVDRAHSAGLGVILDVVYNHLGPEGNYMEQFCDCFFTGKYPNEWGKAINYDGPDSGPVRDFFIANACYWIREFHLDGFRFDATQQIYDNSSEHILKAIAREARRAAGGRSIVLVAENETQNAELVRPAKEGGYGLDAVWNDDFHHAALAALTGRKEAYYSDYDGTPQEFISAARRGFLYQGQYYSWQRRNRGSPTRGLPPEAFVISIENHDQVSNSIHGKRVHQISAPGMYRAVTALMLLIPCTPMLFQGQEYGCSNPFLYFGDLSDSLAKLVRQGRREFLAQFPSIAAPESRAMLSDPSDPLTFTRCKLDPSDRAADTPDRLLIRDLLRLRRNDPVFRLQSEIDGAVLGPQTFVLRCFVPDQKDRIILVNLGIDLRREYVPEPLIAAPPGMVWKMLWSSEDIRYGGGGVPPVHSGRGWDIPGHATTVFRAGTDEPDENRELENG